MIIRYSIPPNLPAAFETDSEAVVLGRRAKGDRPVDLDLDADEYVSHVHARITVENGQAWIEDLGSSNGTFVNDRLIEVKTRLDAGTRAKVGITILEVQLPAAAICPDPDEDADAGETVINVDDVITSFATADLSATLQSPTRDWLQLKAFNDLCQNMGAATTFDALGRILVEQLQKALPVAQRGAILLPDKQGQLLLKAHWPAGDHSVSTTWVTRAFANREAFIWKAAAGCEPENMTPRSAIYYRVQSAIYVPLLAGDHALGVMYVDNHFTREAFSPTDLELMRAIAGQVAVFVKDRILEKDLKREEAVHANLSRQFSPPVARRIMEKFDGLRMGGERVDPVTILVSDVRNFTVMSAKMEPEDVVRMLNEMFDAFVPIVFEHNGVVDKYVGDSVLAVFGSPERDEKQMVRAVQAAVEMQQAITKLGDGRRVRRLPVFEVGIGIHTGEVIHGFIGSSKRMEYTVIGDTVNLAARYCDGAAPGEILISKSVYEHLYHMVEVRPKTITTKHPETEPALEGYVVTSFRT